MERTYELYYNTEYKRKYYYDPEKKESLWEIPPNSHIIDKRTEREKLLDTPGITTEVITPENPEYKKIVSLYPSYFENKSKKAKKRKEPEDSALGEPSEQEIDPEQKEEHEKKYKAYREFRSKHIEELMKRPARKQIQGLKKDTAYLEGNYDYNIWYDKYISDKHNEQERVASLYKCDPEKDTGYTRADIMEKHTSYFCVYFARGYCAEGTKCRYYHRVPQPEDLIYEENAKDVFGRTRHDTFKEDLSGIGCFRNNCRTISVCEMKVPENTATPARDTVKLMYEEMAKWGEIEDIKFLPQRAMANVRYTHRFYAEFAKEAMQDQSLGGSDVLDIKWCIEEDTKTAKEKEDEQRRIFMNALKRKQMAEEQKRQAAIATAKAEQARLEKMKEKQKRHYDRTVDPANMYNPIFYKDYRPGKKVSKDVQKELEQEKSKIAENCVKLNEVLQRISANYQGN